MRNPITIVLFGAAAVTAPAAPPVVAVDTAGTRYGGVLAGADWGRPLAAGDLDGDGYDEVIVSECESWGGVTSRVYVLRGGVRAHGRGWVDLSLTPADQVIIGAQVDDNLGASVATGDVNGDGIDDLLLCASMGDFGGVLDRGVAYLIYGGEHFFDNTVRNLSEGSAWNIRILGPVAAGDMGGSNLFGGLDAQGAAIGRLNADSYGDIVLGVHLADGGNTQSGRVYVIFGNAWPSGFTFNLAVASNYGVRIDGRSRYDELGTCVLTADLTGDGLDELILGNEYYSRGLFTSDGATHIFRGRVTWPTYISLVSTAADITLLGARAQDELGTAAATGDFDGDGRRDLAVAAPGADVGAHNTQRGDGIVYGLLGKTSYQTGTYLFDYATTAPDFRLLGEFEKNLGDTLSAGDFDADGRTDLAAAERFGGPATNGVVEILRGRPGLAGQTFTANVDTDLRILGAPQDRIGFWLSACDHNADGLAEVLIGTPFNNGDRGTAYVFTWVSGDPDRDGDRDLRDVAFLQRCVTGPGGGPLDPPCLLLDGDLDEDLDEYDAAWLCERLTGPGQ